ncbi:MAG: response regulator [Leptolyngbya sp. Prado105]|jgi:carbonic anhydrase/FixJ family two-component response regulator|nr:response regulator [Leptolyngbya sp. Prado105]
MSQNTQVQQSLLVYLRHELCTPINGMIGYSELLLEALQSQPESSLVADVQKIYTCSQQLLKLANIILDPVQLEKNQIVSNLNGFGTTLRIELVTPLSTIIGYCEMLLEEAPAELIPDLDGLNTSAQHLLSLVNDIVYFAQQQLQPANTQIHHPPQFSENLATRLLVQSATTTLQSLSQKPSEKQSQSGMILVVDDNLANCDLLARQLKRQSHAVTTATNAKQALRLLEAIPHDLILLDVVMPGVSGITLLRQLKQHDRFQHIPVIMLSALNETKGAIKCIELGAEDYVQKPFDPALLHAKIGTYLEKKRLQDQKTHHLRPAIEQRIREDSLLQDPNRLSQLALAALPPEKSPVSPDAALQRLLEGNQRFVQGACQNLQQARSRLLETAAAQHPFASILGCADSRVPAEIIFDQGVGDLFVIRVAGNIASQTAIGSLEFATSVLGTQLIVVVGHSDCGAVAAAIKGEPMPGRIGGFVEDIKPVVARVKNKTGDLKANTVIANIQYQAQKLTESSSILADLIQAGHLKIVGGQYDLRTGKFTIVTR